jgi:hypothetical protein
MHRRKSIELIRFVILMTVLSIWPTGYVLSVAPWFPRRNPVSKSSVSTMIGGLRLRRDLFFTTAYLHLINEIT